MLPVPSRGMFAFTGRNYSYINMNQQRQATPLKINRLSQVNGKQIIIDINCGKYVERRERLRTDENGKLLQTTTRIDSLKIERQRECAYERLREWEGEYNQYTVLFYVSVFDHSFSSVIFVYVYYFYIYMGTVMNDFRVTAHTDLPSTHEDTHTHSLPSMVLGNTIYVCIYSIRVRTRLCVCL